MKHTQLILLLLPLLMYSCSSSETYKFDYKSRLADGGMINLTFEVDFYDPGDVEKFKKNLHKVKYALTLVFSRVTTDELSSSGEVRVRNTLRLIIKNQLKKKTRAIRTKNFIIFHG